MALSVVPDACVVAPDGAKATVVVESDNDVNFPAAIEELSSVQGRDAALWYGRTKLGIAPAHMNGNTIGPYAVNQDGVPLEQVRGERGEALPANHPKMQPAKYRIDVPIVRPL